MTAEEVNNALKQATTNNESFGYTDEEIVSSDIIGSHFGSVFDATQTEITAVGDLVAYGEGRCCLSHSFRSFTSVPDYSGYIE